MQQLRNDSAAFARIFTHRTGIVKDASFLQDGRLFQVLIRRNVRLVFFLELFRQFLHFFQHTAHVHFLPFHPCLLAICTLRLFPADNELQDTTKAFASAGFVEMVPLLMPLSCLLLSAAAVESRPRSQSYDPKADLYLLRKTW